MNVLTHLREFFASSDEWAEYCDLAGKVSNLPDGQDRDAVCERTAVLLESIADRAERSGLVRAFGSSSPDALRAEAAEYRAGHDPHA